MRRALSTLLIAAGAVVFAAAPASADPVARGLPITAQGYTDVRSPFATLTGADQPVGTWRDGQNHLHVSKAYFTVDLKPLRGNRLFTVRAHSRETAVADCSKPRSVELWHTKLAEQPTWFQSPKELTRFETGVTGDCHAFVSWEITAAIAKALAAGEEKATFALRMAGGRQFDAGYSRRYAPITVEASYNTPPSAATEPQVNGKPCDGSVRLVGSAPSLHAKVTDADPVPGFQIRYTVADVADPAKRHEGVATYSDGTYYVPAGFVEHGHTYEWTAQGEDGYDRGQASSPCRFTTDLAAPASAPVVTSADFPQTGAGFPGTITFDAGGDEDVVEFTYQGAATGTAKADRPGGKATVTVIVPTSGDKSIEVRSVDRVGHVSPATTFRFSVRPTDVYIFAPPIDAGVLGESYQYWFTSNEPNVTEYVYSVNNGPEITVPAPCDRCSGTASIRVTSWHSTSVSVRARTAEGYLTEAGDSYTPTHPSWPFVTGDRNEIQIAPPSLNGVVVEYLYRVNGATEEQTVAAGPDGSAKLKVDFGDHPFPSIEVRGRTADGLLTQSISFYP